MENPLDFPRFDYTNPCRSCAHPSVGYHTELLEVGVHLPTLCDDLVPEVVVGHRVAAELDHLVAVTAWERLQSVHSVVTPLDVLLLRRSSLIRASTGVRALMTSGLLPTL